jgi:transposase
MDFEQPVGDVNSVIRVDADKVGVEGGMMDFASGRQSIVPNRQRKVLRKRLRRSEVPRFFAALAPCVIGIEACGTRALAGFRQCGRECERNRNCDNGFMGQ